MSVAWSNLLICIPQADVWNVWDSHFSMAPVKKLTSQSSVKKQNSQKLSGENDLLGFVYGCCFLSSGLPWPFALRLGLLTVSLWSPISSAESQFLYGVIENNLTELSVRLVHGSSSHVRSGGWPILSVHYGVSFAFCVKKKCLTYIVTSKVILNPLTHLIQFSFRTFIGVIYVLYWLGCPKAISWPKPLATFVFYHNACMMFVWTNEYVAKVGSYYILAS